MAGANVAINGRAVYKLQQDPLEANNLLAPYVQQHEGGTLEMLIRRVADEPVKSLFIQMEQKLDRLLEETGAAPEPNWRR